jgi:SAM-dependent methyltransferase
MLAVDPRDYQPSLPLPDGLTREQILASLLSFSIDGQGAGDLEAYAREDCDRFLHTLSLVPEGPLRVLEIGANPYFTTHLLRCFRPQAEVTLVNFFGGRDRLGRQSIALTGFDGRTPQAYEVVYHNINIETEALPFDDGAFDLVLYCEVIEHMTDDPLRSLLNLKRVLKHEGHIVLTTPNVARLENVARLLAGANLYDPYSAHGPYGRHNREYTRHELHHLLRYCGFSEEVFFSADVHPNRADQVFDTGKFHQLLAPRAGDLGQYLFTKWRKTGEDPARKPAWLYRSFDPALIDDAERL